MKSEFLQHVKHMHAKNSPILLSLHALANKLSIIPFDTDSLWCRIYILCIYHVCCHHDFGEIFPPSSQIMEYHLCVAIVTIIYESKPKLFESEQNQLQLYGTCIDVLFSRRYKGTYVAQILLLMRIHNLCLCDFFSSFAHFKLVTLGIKKISSLVFWKE